MSENLLPSYYPVAGELFGYLREACKFGELDMSTTTFGLGESPRAFVYRLGVKVGNERYGMKEAVPFFELKSDRIQAVAERIIYKWTGKHERLIEELKDGLQTIQGSEGRHRAESKATPAVS